MSTVADLDAELSAKVETLFGWNPFTRLASDYQDEAGQLLVIGNGYYRQRLTILEQIQLGSNQVIEHIQAQLDILLLMDVADKERDHHSGMWADQLSLTERDFWVKMASVQELVPETTVQVIEDTERNGNILIYQVAADLLLQP